jgi:short-subunit dehydrogenase
MKTGPFQHILITGASSGVGEALALAYAAPGITLSLSGRNTARLTAVAAACKARGAATDAAVLDVTDRDAMADWIIARDRALPLDLVIANAGISSGTSETAQPGMAATRQVFAVNVDGVLNTALPAIAAFRAQPQQSERRRQIALVSSLASFRYIGGSPAYGAAKAAVRVWGEGMRATLAHENIGVTVVCPGFVVSRMTAVNNFTMPFLMEAEPAARIIQRGIADNKGRVAFPWQTAALVWFLSFLPNALAERFTRRLPGKT